MDLAPVVAMDFMCWKFFLYFCGRAATRGAKTTAPPSGAKLCWALGVIICNFTPILPYFQHWGGWISTKTFFRQANLVKTKKRSSPEMEHFFSPNSSTDLRSDAHQSQINGGDADEDHTQIVGGYTVKLLGGYIPPSPRVSAPLVPPNCLFPCGSFKTVAFVFWGPTENSQKSRPIWRDNLSFSFFFEINGELGVM